MVQSLVSLEPHTSIVQCVISLESTSFFFIMAEYDQPVFVWEGNPGHEKTQKANISTYIQSFRSGRITAQSANCTVATVFIHHITSSQEREP